MSCQKFYGIESGKDCFVEFIKTKAVFNEGQRNITDEIEKLRIKTEDIELKTDKTIRELAGPIPLRKSKRQKKLVYIEALKHKKEDNLKNTDELKEQLKNLKLFTFGKEEIPKIHFGRYKKNNASRMLPIEWDVMQIKNNRALLLSSYIIECMPYAQELTPTAWKESKIRQWLNEEFYQNSFLDTERKMICQAKIQTPGNEEYKTPASPDTKDYIFIPSADEVEEFYNYDFERAARATEYAVKNGVYKDEQSGNSYWWLRSTGGTVYNASVINFKGYLYEYGFFVNSGQYGVRPALWIEL